jgi:hypothetical protein
VSFSHPPSAFGAPPWEGGAASGPAKPDPRRALGFGVVLVALFLLAASARAQAATPPSVPDDAEVARALQVLRSDPDLNGEDVTHRLRLKERGKPEQRKPDEPLPQGWLTALRWIGEAGRALVWVGGAIVVAFVLVSLRRWWRVRAEAREAMELQLPSHVRDLDIRPDSLPEDIGAAARALWQAGEARAALSLLYRGALSRMVHVHRVPVRAATTEGESVRLAERHLPAAGAEFVERLVRAWQLAVYGARLPADGVVMALCEGFDAAWAESTLPAPQEASA